MMQRTQVSLATEEHRRARQRASDLGISLAEYIRRLVRSDLDAPTARGDVRALFALGNSGDSDVSREKDRYVGEALAARRRR